MTLKEHLNRFFELSQLKDHYKFYRSVLSCPGIMKFMLNNKDELKRCQDELNRIIAQYNSEKYWFQRKLPVISEPE